MICLGICIDNFRFVGIISQGNYIYKEGAVL